MPIDDFTDPMDALIELAEGNPGAIIALAHIGLYCQQHPDGPSALRVYQEIEAAGIDPVRLHRLFNFGSPAEILDEPNPLQFRFAEVIVGLATGRILPADLADEPAEIEWDQLREKARNR